MKVKMVANNDKYESTKSRRRGNVVEEDVEEGEMVDGWCADPFGAITIDLMKRVCIGHPSPLKKFIVVSNREVHRII